MGQRAVAAELLGDLYAKNAEPERAAACYQWADKTKKLTDLAATVGDRLLPPSPVGAGPWWQQATSLTGVAVQRDLLDDDNAARLLTRSAGRYHRTAKMITSVENRTPAKPDLGADTRAGRRRINPACPLAMIADATVPPDRYTDAKSRKNCAGTSPITRASGKKKIVRARFVHNDRLIDAS